MLRHFRQKTLRIDVAVDQEAFGTLWTILHVHQRAKVL